MNTKREKYLHYGSGLVGRVPRGSLLLLGMNCGAPALPCSGAVVGRGSSWGGGRVAEEMGVAPGIGTWQPLGHREEGVGGALIHTFCLSSLPNTFILPLFLPSHPCEWSLRLDLGQLAGCRPRSSAQRTPPSGCRHGWVNHGRSCWFVHRLPPSSMDSTPPAG